MSGISYRNLSIYQGWYFTAVYNAEFRGNAERHYDDFRGDYAGINPKFRDDSAGIIQLYQLKTRQSNGQMEEGIILLWKSSCE